MKSIIEVENLVKQYKNATANAVDDISFHVEEGEFFSLLGPNGAGKTTTISILTTTLSKTSGKVIIAGQNIDKGNSQVREHIGIIFQNPSLDQNLTAEENIRFHTILYKLYPFRPTFSMMDERYQKKVLELADILGIQKEIFRPIKTFSGGMKRKLEIMRSLMHNPKILYLDEPTIGLDPLSRKNLWEYLTEVRKKENITMFLTTHYLEEAEDANRICIIKNGKIVSRGTPNQIKRHLINEYLEVETKEKEKLEDELKKLDITYKKLENMYHIDLGKHSVQELIHHIKTPLLHVRTHTPTLEEAYIEIIEKEEEKK